MEFFIRRRITCLILTACMAFMVISADASISDEHDCTGKKCLICLHIYAYKNIVKVATCLLIDSIQQLQYKELKPWEIKNSFFLIEQKVRLNT